ncbi:MAG: glutathionylspermidine synthase family protein [Gemmatimonadaceae bacterium]
MLTIASYRTRSARRREPPATQLAIPSPAGPTFLTITTTAVGCGGGVRPGTDRDSSGGLEASQPREASRAAGLEQPAPLTVTARASDPVRRIPAATRVGWVEKVAAVGLTWHSREGIPYWDESAYYAFTPSEIDTLEAATNELHAMCLNAVQHVVDRGRWTELAIPERAISIIERSWREEPPSIYGRFDLAYDGSSPPKLLEYNADTPTALLEAAVVQWYWLEELHPTCDQFNSIHERLVSGWKDLAPSLQPGPLYFAAMDDWEDAVTTAYLRDTALQAGLASEQLRVSDIGWQSASRRFVDLADRPLGSCFKLYPWEWMVREEFGAHLTEAAGSTQWIEPPWKMILSNKGILPILWELYPNHPNLLECYFESDRARLATYVRKPLLSREGANITIASAGSQEQTSGTYGSEGYVYQALTALTSQYDRFAVIGSWVIRGEAAGIGIRESLLRVTDNQSRFVPHLFG